MTLTLTIPDMACGACANTITQAVQAVDSAATVNADLATKVVTIDSQQSPETIQGAIVAAGYTIA
jgi:copper chaperone